MGGFSVWINRKEIEYFNLPARNRFLAALFKSKGIINWCDGTIWKCSDCMLSEIKKADFIAGLETLKNNKTWIGDAANRMVKKLNKSKEKTIRIEDELMICEHSEITNAKE